VRDTNTAIYTPEHGYLVRADAAGGAADVGGVGAAGRDGRCCGAPPGRNWGNDGVQRSEIELKNQY
jgi:hypothetical protein